MLNLLRVLKVSEYCSASLVYQYKILLIHCAIQRYTFSKLIKDMNICSSIVKQLLAAFNEVGNVFFCWHAIHRNILMQFRLA